MSFVGSVEAVPDFGQVVVGNVLACVENADFIFVADIFCTYFNYLVARAMRNGICDIVFENDFNFIILRISFKRTFNGVSDRDSAFFKFKRKVI